MGWLFKCDWCLYTYDHKPIIVKVGNKKEKKILTLCCEECFKKFKNTLPKSEWEFIKLIKE